MTGMLIRLVGPTDELCGVLAGARSRVVEEGALKMSAQFDATRVRAVVLRHRKTGKSILRL